MLEDVDQKSQIGTPTTTSSRYWEGTVSLWATMQSSGEHRWEGLHSVQPQGFEVSVIQSLCASKIHNSKHRLRFEEVYCHCHRNNKVTFRALSLHRLVKCKVQKKKKAKPQINK